MKKATSFRQIVFLIVVVLFFGFLSYWLVIFFRRSVSWRTFVVQSGSMEPAIMTGDVVIIKKFSEYQKAEVITFKDNSNRTITHRIFEKNEDNTFITKGDANQTNDPEAIPSQKIIGKVVMTLPKFGYVIQFVKSPWGFILCIIVPSTLILYDESKAIIQEFKKGRSRRN